MSNIGKVVGTLGIRGVSIGTQLLLFVLIARETDVTTVGIFAIANTIWFLSRSLLPLGWNLAILRRVSVLKSQSQHKYALRLLMKASVETLLFAGAVMVAAVIVASAVGVPLSVAFFVSLVAILWSQIGILSAYLRACGSIIQSQISDSLTIYAIPFAVCFALPLQNIDLTLNVIFAAFFVSAVVACLMMVAFVVVDARRNIGEGHGGGSLVRERAMAHRLWWPQVFTTFSSRLPILIAAPIAGAAATAMIETGLRTQLVGATLAWAGGIIASPRYAVAHDRQDHAAQKLLPALTWASAIPTAGVVLVILFFGDPLLAILGEEYAASRLTIALMATASLLEVPAATSGYFLMMTGREKIANLGTAAQCISILVISVCVGPFLGALGIAAGVLAGAFVRSTIVIACLHRSSVISPISPVGLRTLSSWFLRKQ